jgi:hypothetical protein
VSVVAQHTHNAEAYLAPYSEITELAELLLEVSEVVDALASKYQKERFVKEAPV